MADKISGSSRRELPPTGSRPVWGAEGEGPSRGMAVPARCGLRLSSSFIILVECDGQDTLRVRFAVPVTPDGNPTHGQIPPGIELSRRIEMRGRVVVASDYAGCPWCGGEIIFRCGCGVLNCSGASRTHGDHQDRFCAACREWGCVRGGASLKELSGFAPAAPCTRVEASHLGTIERVDRPALSSGGALVRRG
jgi:hypothetical protein